MLWISYPIIGKSIWGTRCTCKLNYNIFSLTLQIGKGTIFCLSMHTSNWRCSFAHQWEALMIIHGGKLSLKNHFFNAAEVLPSCLRMHHGYSYYKFCLCASTCYCFDLSKEVISAPPYMILPFSLSFCFALQIIFWLVCFLMCTAWYEVEWYTTFASWSFLLPSIRAFLCSIIRSIHVCLVMYKY